MLLASRNADGDIDLSLIPQDVRDWYESLSDEKDTFEECESDVKCAWCIRIKVYLSLLTYISHPNTFFENSI